MLGIGAQHTKDPNGIAWKQNRDFENLLKRLNANSEGPTEDGASSAPIDGFHPACVDEPVMDGTTVGSETEGRDEQERAEREKKNQKKKRPWDSGETAETERKRKKRKDAGSTTAESASEPVEAGSPSSSSPTQGTISFAVTAHSCSKATPDSCISSTSSKPHRRGRAHRARFIASKRLAATSSVAVAEILGISSSSVTPISVSGVATPEATPQAEYDEHRHLTVSSKCVAEYFKEKIQLVSLRSSGSKLEIDETPRGGIGSRLEFWGHDEVEEGGGFQCGLGMGLLAKMSAAVAVTEHFVQAEETSERKGKKKEEERGERKGGVGEGDASHKPKKKGKKKARIASD